MIESQHKVEQDISDRILDRISEGYILYDREWRFVTVNHAAARFLGLPKAQLEGQSLPELFPRQVELPVFETLKRIRDSRQEEHFEYWSPRLGIWLKNDVYPVNGGIEIYISDITERKKLEENARYLETLTHSIADALISTDAHYRIVSWNAAAERIYGWTAEEAIGYPAPSLLHTDLGGDADAQQKMLSQLYHAGNWAGEVRQVRKDGTTIHIEAHLSVLRDEYGAIIGTVAFNHDISKRKRAENAVRESGERLRAMFNQAGVGVCLLSTDYLLLEVNPKFSSIVGYTAEELLNTSCMELTHPDDRAANAQALEELLRTEKDTATFEKRYLRKNQTTVWGRITIAKIRDEHSVAQQFVAFVEDISEYKKAEAGLRESESRFRILAENIQSMAWMANPDGWIFWCNQRWYEYLGRSFETIKGWGWEKTLHPDHAQRVHEFLAAAWKKGEPWEMTFPLKGKDGSYRWFLTSGFPVRDNSGELLRWIGTCTDVNALKAPE